MAYNRLLFEYDLPHRAVAVYMYLRSGGIPWTVGAIHPYLPSRLICIFPPGRSIGRWLNWSRPGFVERIPRSRASGARSSSQYWLKK